MVNETNKILKTKAPELKKSLTLYLASEETEHILFRPCKVGEHMFKLHVLKSLVLSLNKLMSKSTHIMLIWMRCIHVLIEHFHLMSNQSAAASFLPPQLGELSPIYGTIFSASNLFALKTCKLCRNSIQNCCTVASLIQHNLHKVTVSTRARGGVGPPCLNSLRGSLKEACSFLLQHGTTGDEVLHILHSHATELACRVLGVHSIGYCAKTLGIMLQPSTAN